MSPGRSPVRPTVGGRLAGFRAAWRTACSATTTTTMTCRRFWHHGVQMLRTQNAPDNQGRRSIWWAFASGPSALATLPAIARGATGFVILARPRRLTQLVQRRCRSLGAHTGGQVVLADRWRRRRAEIPVGWYRKARSDHDVRQPRNRHRTCRPDQLPAGSRSHCAQPAAF